MIPLKWEVIQVGVNQGYPSEGLFLRVTLVQGGEQFHSQEFRPVSECRAPYLWLTLERMQHEVLRQDIGERV